MIAAIIAQAVETQTERAVTALILLLLAVAALLTVLTAWYWRHTSPRRVQRRLGRRAAPVDLDHPDPAYPDATYADPGYGQPGYGQPASGGQVYAGGAQPESAFPGVADYPPIRPDSAPTIVQPSVQGGQQVPGRPSAPAQHDPYGRRGNHDW